MFRTREGIRSQSPVAETDYQNPSACMYIPGEGHDIGCLLSGGHGLHPLGSILGMGPRSNPN